MGCYGKMKKSHLNKQERVKSQKVTYWEGFVALSFIAFNLLPLLPFHNNDETYNVHKDTDLNGFCIFLTGRNRQKRGKITLNPNIRNLPFFIIITLRQCLKND